MLLLPPNDKTWTFYIWQYERMASYIFEPHYNQSGLQNEVCSSANLLSALKPCPCCLPIRFIIFQIDILVSSWNRVVAYVSRTLLKKEKSFLYKLKACLVYVKWETAEGLSCICESRENSRCGLIKSVHDISTLFSKWFKMIPKGSENITYDITCGMKKYGRRYTAARRYVTPDTVMISNFWINRLLRQRNEYSKLWRSTETRFVGYDKTLRRRRL